MIETPPPELIEIVLAEFQTVLRENLKYPWKPNHGHPPRYGYVEQTEWTEKDFQYGKAIAAWHVSPDAVNPTPVHPPKPPKIDGMFYDLLGGFFCFTDDFSMVSINWQTGPRFGRGFKHRIGKDTAGRYLLSKGVNTWVS